MNIETKVSPRSSHARQFLALGFLLLGFVVVMSFWFAHEERRDDLVAQTTLVNTKRLGDLLSTMRQAETGERAYLLTGDKRYLTNYYQVALLALPGELQVLQEALGSGPDAANLAVANRTVAFKLNELSGSITMFQAGNLAGAITLMQNNLNNHSITRLRDIIGTMETAQSDRLAKERAVDARHGMLMQLATTLAVIATLMLAWFAIRENRVQNDQLRAAEAALIKTNDALERKVEERTSTLRASEAALAEANASLELRVAERSRELDRIFRLSTDILAVIDFDGRFVNVSPAWEKITGWTIADALTKPFDHFLHPEDMEASRGIFEKMSKGAPVIDFENRYRCADGSYCWLSWRSVPHPDDRLVYNVARDITKEKAREEQLRQSQKMEVVGQLTGGIAHDFNNLLTIIMGSLEMLQRGLADAEPKLLRRVENAMDGAKRAASLTHRLLAFSRQQPLAPKAVDANRLIAGMADMLHRTLGEAVAIEIVAGAGVWQALADGNQLENAVLNLAVNARDAMPNGGHLTVETQNAYLDDDYAASRDDVQPGQYVQIAVTDTGTGMPANVRTKVFEPFFTTKPQGQGTGLGLAQVYGFIKQSGGHIAIYSELGQGTTVKLYLPRWRGGGVVETAAHDTEANADIRGRGETILLVEDEEGVRNFSVEVLRDLGYNVLPAENAAAALEIFASTPGIKMLFTDVVLTGNMNGRVLANEILRRAPDTIVLFTTGYTRNAIIHHGRLDDGVNFIGKPFTASALSLLIRKLFDSVSSGQLSVASGQ